jgi:hypothetical protein
MLHGQQVSPPQLSSGRSTFSMISRKNGRRHMRSTTRVASPGSSCESPSHTMAPSMQLTDSSCSDVSCAESTPSSPLSNGPLFPNERDLTPSDNFDYSPESGELVYEDSSINLGEAAPKKRFRVRLFCFWLVFSLDRCSRPPQWKYGWVSGQKF